MKFVRFLGSLKFACFLIVVLAVILVASTAFEARYGTEFAAEFVYRAKWFDLLLGLIGLNVFLAALFRYPFKKRHTAFLCTHLGIVVLLLGALVARIFGIEGYLTLREGETNKRVTKREYELFISVSEDRTQKFKISGLKSIWGGSRRRRLINDRLEVSIGQIIENATRRIIFTEGSDSDPTNHAIRLTLLNEQMNLKESFWLAENNPFQAHGQFVSLGPLLIRLAKKGDLVPSPEQMFGFSGRPQLTIYYSEDNWTLSTAAESPEEIKLTPGEIYPLQWMSLRLRVDRLWPHALLSEQVIFVENDPDGQLALDTSLFHDGKLVFRKWLFADQIETAEFASQKIKLGVLPGLFELPFSLKLRDFRKIDYPGTKRAAAFESDVVIVDQVENLTAEHTISMNNPLDYKGFRIFQSSYGGTPGAAERSVFQIASNPGIPLIYLGSCLIFVGIFLLFYIESFSSLGAVHGSYCK